MRSLILALSLTLATLAFSLSDQTQVVDQIARTEIAHLKELLNAADKRYEQRFNAQETAVAAGLNAQEKAIAAALSAAKEAVTKAEIAAEKRLDSVNEFRGQLRDQQATFISKAEAEQRLLALSEKLNSLQQRVDKNEGKNSGFSEGWGYVIGAIGLALGVFGAYRILVPSNRQADRR